MCYRVISSACCRVPISGRQASSTVLGNKVRSVVGSFPHEVSFTYATEDTTARSSQESESGLGNSTASFGRRPVPENNLGFAPHDRVIRTRRLSMQYVFKAGSPPRARSLYHARWRQRSSIGVAPRDECREVVERTSSRPGLSRPRLRHAHVQATSARKRSVSELRSIDQRCCTSLSTGSLSMHRDGSISTTRWPLDEAQAGRSSQQ